MATSTDFWADLEWRTRTVFIGAFGEARVLELSSPSNTSHLNTKSDKYRYLQSIATTELAKYNEIEQRDQYIKVLKAIGWAQDWNREWSSAIPTWRAVNINSPPTSPDLPALYNLAENLVYNGNHADGEAMFRILLHLLRITIGESSPQVIGAYCHLAQAIYGQGRKEETEKVIEEVRTLAGTIEDEEQRKEAVEEIEGTKTWRFAFQYE